MMSCTILNSNDDAIFPAAVACFMRRTLNRYIKWPNGERLHIYIYIYIYIYQCVSKVFTVVFINTEIT